MTNAVVGINEILTPILTMAGKNNKRFGSATLPWGRHDKKFSLRARLLAEICLSEMEEYTLSRQIFTGLDFSLNQLTSLNMGLFCRFPHLIWIGKLDLSSNEIELLPLNLDLLRNLTHLDLHSNNIKALVPCLANMRNLVWFNVNRNPINSLVPGFRDIVGSMATDQDCRIAAQRVVAWMAEELKMHERLRYTDGDRDDDCMKGMSLKRRIRDLSRKDGTSLAQNVSRLIVVRPEGCTPFAAQVLAPMEVMRSRWCGENLFKSEIHLKKWLRYLLIITLCSLMTASIFSSNELANLLSATGFIFPTFFINFLQGIHKFLQSTLQFFFPQIVPVGITNILETLSRAVESLTYGAFHVSHDSNSIATEGENSAFHGG